MNKSPTAYRTSGQGHLVSSLKSTGISTGASALSSLVKIPLAVAAVGVPAFGVISTVASLYGWVALLSAGSRTASSALIAPRHGSPDTEESIRIEVGVATLRLAAPLLGILAIATLTLPVTKVVDPSAAMSSWGLRLAMLAGLAFGLLSIDGGARLGIATTLGRFRLQNAAVVCSAVGTTVLVSLGAYLNWTAAVICVVWLFSLATPALPAAIRFPSGLRRLLALNKPDEDARGTTRSAIWISAGQQFASGFDLVIVSIYLGSVAAAQYGLLFRLLQVLLTPGLAAAPAVMRAAGHARRDGTTGARLNARRVLVSSCAVQGAALLVALPLSPLAFHVLSNGDIAMPTALLWTGFAWAVTDFARRVLVAVTGTTRGFQMWRRATIWSALPNLVLSVALTPLVGVAGPMLGSLAGALLMLAFVLPRLREETLEVLRAG